MIDLSTGMPITRRDFGKGLAAIIASGVAPRVASAVPFGLQRGLGLRLGAMGGGKTKTPFIRITPTTTSYHYPPFNTGITFAAEDDWKLDLGFRLYGQAISTWGPLFGNGSYYNSGGLWLRERVDTKNCAVYVPMTNGSATADNSKFFDSTNFGHLVIDTSIVGNGFIKWNNGEIGHYNFYFDRSKWTITSVPLYIGESQYARGASIATDWLSVKIWKNGELVRDYIPHTSGGFMDLVSGNPLARNPSSSTTAVYMEE